MTRTAQVRGARDYGGLYAYQRPWEVAALQDFITVRGAGKYKGLQLVNFNKVSATHRSSTRRR